MTIDDKITREDVERAVEKVHKLGVLGCHAERYCAIVDYFVNEELHLNVENKEPVKYIQPELGLVYPTSQKEFDFYD